MRLRAPRHLGRAEADNGAAGDEGGLVGGLGGLDGGMDRLGIVPIHPGGRPAGGGKARQLVGRARQGGGAVDGDEVVIPQHGQLGELQVAGEIRRLLADALHEVAVGGEHEGTVIHDVRPESGSQRPLRHGHADRGGNALAQRPRGGLDAFGDEILGVARGERAQLPEALDLVHGHLLEAEQVHDGIKQHGAMAGGEHETVTIRPMGRGRIDLQHLGEQNGRHVRRPHGQARMAAIGGLHRVHGQEPDGVGHTVVALSARHDFLPPASESNAFSPWAGPPGRLAALLDGGLDISARRGVKPTCSPAVKMDIPTGTAPHRRAGPHTESHAPRRRHPKPWRAQLGALSGSFPSPLERCSRGLRARSSKRRRLSGFRSPSDRDDAPAGPSTCRVAIHHAGRV